MPNPDDATLIRILSEAKTIAGVGGSEDSTKGAHRVPMSLQIQGYRIIPVNPTADAILGEKAYTSLSAVPVPYDVVDLFRPSRDIPPIADEARRGRGAPGRAR